MIVLAMCSKSIDVSASLAVELTGHELRSQVFVAWLLVREYGAQLSRGVWHRCTESKVENTASSIANCRTFHCQSRFLQLACLMSLLLRTPVLLSGYCNVSNA